MKSTDAQQAKIESLRKKVAEAEATLGTLRSRLANAEAKLTGEKSPETGLDMLWTAALPKSRERSSKHRCRVEWNRIPKHERPTVQQAIEALRAWNRSDEWKKDGNAFAPGLHRWINARMWEDLPESDKPAPSRYRTAPKPAPVVPPEEQLTREELANFFNLKRPFSPSLNPQLYPPTP